MKRIIASLVAIGLLCSGCASKPNRTLTIAAAANMQFAMKELTREFTTQSGIPCTITVSSSGKLTSQIQAGAPYDVFVSANLKYPNSLHNQGLTLGEPKVYALGRLVMWTMKTDINPTLESLVDESISYVAIANPKFSPYGQAGIESLKASKVYSQIKEKLIFGESIAQVNQFILSSSADVGFTSKSVVLSTKVDKEGQWQEINHTLHAPIQQGLVILKNQDNQRESAYQFQEFLFSKTGQNILKKYGYEPI